jgi:hypothetical protein
MASEGMKYGMLGVDHSTTDEKLAKYKGVVGWDYLSGPQKNGVLYFVDPDLALEEVGEAVVRDESAQIRAWLQSADLVLLEEIHAAQWQGSDQEFEALVVSPFVFCRPLS